MTYLSYETLKIPYQPWVQTYGFYELFIKQSLAVRVPQSFDVNDEKTEALEGIMGVIKND